MLLSQKFVSSFSSGFENLCLLPEVAHFHFPEKVLQFGTGVLLRGLPDFFIDKANKQGIFNGRILVVKSTQGSASDFEAQNNLYTLAVRGIENDKKVEEYTVNAAISRVISANDQWEVVLEAARNPLIQIVISNTTEVGIQYVAESIFQQPPASFPAKLTAFLYERFVADIAVTTVIIPTELIENNGKKLKAIVLKLSENNALHADFIGWLEKHVIFCNSLVDRIVTGMPDAQTAEKIYEKLGFEDQLLTLTEPYRLWAIEGDERVESILSFAAADAGVVIADDITYFRERKLRILNGSHTIGVGKGFLSGFNTVNECMQDQKMKDFFVQVIHQEIVPTVGGANQSDITTFADAILDRFQNPNIEHLLLSITFQYTSKMRMRNIPTIFRYYQKFNHLPEKMVEGFAAYLYFMKAIKEENGRFYGKRNDDFYWINDDFAGYYFRKWQAMISLENLVQNVSADIEIWGQDLTQLPDWTKKVSGYLALWLEKQMA
jgi:tagaturonate reductase